MRCLTCSGTTFSKGGVGSRFAGFLLSAMGPHLSWFPESLPAGDVRTSQRA